MHDICVTHFVKGRNVCLTDGTRCRKLCVTLPRSLQTSCP